MRMCRVVSLQCVAIVLYTDFTLSDVHVCQQLYQSIQTNLMGT